MTLPVENVIKPFNMPPEFNPNMANIFQVKLDHEYGYTLVKVVILQGNFSIDYHVIYPVLHFDKKNKEILMLL